MSREKLIRVLGTLRIAKSNLARGDCRCGALLGVISLIENQTALEMKDRFLPILRQKKTMLY